MGFSALVGSAARHAAAVIGSSRLRTGRGNKHHHIDGRSGAPNRVLAESLETRRLLTTVSLVGNHSYNSFIAQLDASGTNVQFFINANPATATPSQTVPLSQFTGLSVDGVAP